jgi:ABC-type transport system substrate-binding protein
MMLAPLPSLARSRGWRRRGLASLYLTIALTVGVFGWRSVSLWRLPNSPEPFDLVKFTEKTYYFGYQSEAFDKLYQSIVETPNEADRAKLLGDAQRMLATDAAAGFLFQPQWITIINKKLKGVWKDVPQFENDFSSWSWE